MHVKALQTVLPLRLMRDVSPRVLWHFVVGAGAGNFFAFQRFKRRVRKGRIFPPIVFVSVTQRCNLSCQGCWSTGVKNPVDMDPSLLDQVVRESASQGCRFFGILGGEPLLLPWLPAFFRQHPKQYFQLFTNGRFLDAAMAQTLRDAGNVSPLISIEGVGASYQARRGDPGMYAAAHDAIRHCHAAGLVTGVATSVSASNFQDVVNPAFIDAVVEEGAHYVWYYIYRPSGPQPGFEEALKDEQVLDVRRFLLEQRRRVKSAVLIDTYWDEAGRPRCPAATGISIHVNARGAIEPCPPVQCSDCRTDAQRNLVEQVEGSAWLKTFQAEIPSLTTGCVLMDNPDALIALAGRCGAIDSSGRDRFFEELAGRPMLGCHNHSGDPMPETSWMYRMAKKMLFFGFGAYG